MRISDWSSDVCSSDLFAARGAGVAARGAGITLLPTHPASTTALDTTASRRLPENSTFIATPNANQNSPRPWRPGIIVLQRRHSGQPFATNDSSRTISGGTPGASRGGLRAHHSGVEALERRKLRRVPPDDKIGRAHV